MQRSPSYNPPPSPLLSFPVKEKSAGTNKLPHMHTQPAAARVAELGLRREYVLNPITALAFYGGGGGDDGGFPRPIP